MSERIAQNSTGEEFPIHMMSESVLMCLCFYKSLFRLKIYNTSPVDHNTPFPALFKTKLRMIYTRGCDSRCVHYGCVLRLFLPILRCIFVQQCWIPSIMVSGRWRLASRSWTTAERSNARISSLLRGEREDWVGKNLWCGTTRRTTSWSHTGQLYVGKRKGT